MGFDAGTLQGWFGSVQRAAATIDNRVGLDNDEQGAAVWVCRGPRPSWAELWPELRRLG